MTFNIPLKGLRLRALPPDGAPRKLLHYLGNGEAELAIDNSSIEAQTTCDRSAEYKLVHSRIGDSSYALTYGGAWHKCLEDFYTARMNGTEFSLSETLARAEKIFVANPPPLGAWRTYDKLCGAFSRYVERFSKEDNFKVIKCEQAFSHPLMRVPINAPLQYPKELLFDNPEEIDDALISMNGDIGLDVIHVSWTGVIDMIVELDGERWLLDHKTTSIEGDQFWKNFELSQQFLGYHWTAEKIMDCSLKGAIANVIYGREDAKTPAGIKTQREKEFLRRFYHYTPEHVAEWEVNMKFIIEDFIHNLLNKRFPMKTAHCVNKYGTCPYHDVCTLTPDTRMTMLYSSQFINNVWNPLN